MFWYQHQHPPKLVNFFRFCQLLEFRVTFAGSVNFWDLTCMQVLLASLVNFCRVRQLLPGGASLASQVLPSVNFYQVVLASLVGSFLSISGYFS